MRKTMPPAVWPTHSGSLHGGEATEPALLDCGDSSGGTYGGQAGEVSESVEDPDGRYPVAGEGRETLPEREVIRETGVDADKLPTPLVDSGECPSGLRGPGPEAEGRSVQPTGRKNDYTRTTRESHRSEEVGKGREATDRRGAAEEAVPARHRQEVPGPPAVKVAAG